MSFSFIPAIQKLKNKHEIVPVGSEEVTFYLYKRFGRTVGERQLIDAEQSNHNEGQFLLAQLADKIAKDRNISFNQALEFIFPPNPEDSKYSDVPGHLEAIADFKPMVEYSEEMKSLNALKAKTNRLQCAITTIMMQTRAAFPIQLADNAEINAEEIKVASLAFPIADKSVFKSGNALVTVVGNYQPSEDEVTITVKPLTQNLAAERIFFLADFETGKEKIGCPEWTPDNTAVLPEDVVEAIHGFYQREEAGLGEVQEEVAEKNEEPTQKKAAKKSLKPGGESVSNHQ